MPDNFISGVDGYVKLGALAYNFKNWKLSVDPGLKKFFAFGSAFQRTLPGGIAGVITCTGPLNKGNTPLVPGVVYEFHLGWAFGLELVVNARLGPTDFETEISQGGDPAGVSITADSEGAFGISFT